MRAYKRQTIIGGRKNTFLVKLKCPKKMVLLCWTPPPNRFYARIPHTRLMFSVHKPNIWSECHFDVIPMRKGITPQNPHIQPVAWIYQDYLMYKLRVRWIWLHLNCSFIQSIVYFALVIDRITSQFKKDLVELCCCNYHECVLLFKCFFLYSAVAITRLGYIDTFLA